MTVLHMTCVRNFSALRLRQRGYGRASRTEHHFRQCISIVTIQWISQYSTEMVLNCEGSVQVADILQWNLVNQRVEVRIYWRETHVESVGMMDGIARNRHVFASLAL